MSWNFRSKRALFFHFVWQLLCFCCFLWESALEMEKFSWNENTCFVYFFMRFLFGKEILRARCFSLQIFRANSWWRPTEKAALMWLFWPNFLWEVLSRTSLWIKYREYNFVQNDKSLFKMHTTVQTRIDRTRGDCKRPCFVQLHTHILERQQNRDSIRLRKMNAPCARAIFSLKYLRLKMDIWSKVS